jgi:hypothetical protein
MIVAIERERVIHEAKEVGTHHDIVFEDNRFIVPPEHLAKAVDDVARQPIIAIAEDDLRVREIAQLG